MENRPIIRKSYRPIKVSDFLTKEFSYFQSGKCRTLGYLVLEDGDFYLKNLDSAIGGGKIKIRVLFKTSVNFPVTKAPQGVQIFGSVLCSMDKDTCSRRWYIRAEIVQVFPPSLLFRMQRASMQIPSLPEQIAN